MTVNRAGEAGPVQRRAGRGRPGRANAPANDNPGPGTVYVSGELVVTPKGRTRAPVAGPATEMLDRLALAVGPEGLVMIGPDSPSWSYLVDPLASAWTITGGPAWFTATRGATRLRLVLLGQVTGTNDPMLAPDPLTAVVRHQRFANLAGVSFYADGGATGALLMEQLVRPRGANVLRAWNPEGAPRLAEPPWLGPWARGEYGATTRIDKNAYYLCAANSVQLPIDGLERTGPEAKPADRVGLWRIRTPANHERDHLPHVLGGRPGVGELRWVAHPTMELLAELDIPVKVADSWTAPRDRARRLLVPWYERLRDARARLLESMPDDPEAAVILAAVKDTYSRGIGCLDRQTRRWSRPDWRAMIYATARCNMYRTLLKAGTDQRMWPASVRTDSVFYEGAEVPEAFRLGTGMGQWKVVTNG